MHASKHHAIVIACDGKVVAEITVTAVDHSAIEAAERVFVELFGAAKFEAYGLPGDIGLPPIDGGELPKRPSADDKAEAHMRQALKSMRDAALELDRSGAMSSKLIRDPLWAARTNAEVVLETLGCPL